MHSSIPHIKTQLMTKISNSFRNLTKPSFLYLEYRPRLKQQNPKDNF